MFSCSCSSYFCQQLISVFCLCKIIAVFCLFISLPHSPPPPGKANHHHFLMGYSGLFCRTNQQQQQQQQQCLSQHVKLRRHFGARGGGVNGNFLQRKIAKFSFFFLLLFLLFSPFFAVIVSASPTSIAGLKLLPLNATINTDFNQSTTVISPVLSPPPPQHKRSVFQPISSSSPSSPPPPVVARIVTGFRLEGDEKSITDHGPYEIL